MADETQLSSLLGEVVVRDNSPLQFAALYAEATHQTKDIFPLQITNVYAEVTHQTKDIYQTQIGSVHMEVIRSLYDAIRPALLDGESTGDTGQIWGPTIPTGVPKITAKTVERNPYAAHLPETQEEKEEYDREQQKILREQHNKTQAGDTTFDYGLLLKTYSNKAFTLGSLGRFYHPDYGMILARFCLLDGFVDSLFQGQPVGRLKSAKNELVDWVVTNDYSKSGADLAVGLVFFADTPADKSYGWVVVNGPNPTVVSNLGTAKPKQNQAFGWVASNRLGADAEGCVLARTWAWTGEGTLKPGTLFIEVERWSLASLQAIVRATTQDTIDAVASLTQRVTANETESSQNAANIKAANEVIEAVKRSLDREIQVRTRQIDALRQSVNNNGDFSVNLAELRIDLENKITSGDHENLVKIQNNLREIASLRAQLGSLSVDSVNSQLDAIGQALGNLSQLINPEPSQAGVVMVSFEVPKDPDSDPTNAPTYEFAEVQYRLANLTDVDTTGIAPGSILKWNASSSKFVVGDLNYLVPAGGTAGQLLAKKTATDGDLEWVNPPSGGGGGGGSGGGVWDVIADITAPTSGEFTLTGTDLSAYSSLEIEINGITAAAAFDIRFQLIKDSGVISTGYRYRTVCESTNGSSAGSQSITATFANITNGGDSVYNAAAGNPASMFMRLDGLENGRVPHFVAVGSYKFASGNTAMIRSAGLQDATEAIKGIRIFSSVAFTAGEVVIRGLRRAASGTVTPRLPYWMGGTPPVPVASDFTIQKSDAAIPTSVFEESSGIVLEVRPGPAPAADRTVVLEKTVPSAVFDFQAMIVTQNLQRAYQNIGLYCRNQTTGRFMTFGLGDNQQWGYNVLRWNTMGNYNSSVTNNGRRMPDTPLWLRLLGDGTTLHWSISKNGKYWTGIHGIAMTDWVGADARGIGIHYIASQVDGPQNVNEYLHVMGWRLS